MSEEWEIDPLEFTLNDLAILEEGLQPGASAAQLRETLGRLVTNKTPQEIGDIPLRELYEHVEKLTKTIADMSIPKLNTTP